MSDEDQLSPAERELETALRSLRPRAARIDVVSVKSFNPTPSRLRFWRAGVVAAAAALAVAGGAWLIAWHGRAGHHHLAGSSPRVEPEIATIEGQLAPPTLRAYRWALDRSPAELNALLDRQAIAGRSRGENLAAVNAVSLWGVGLNSITGDL